MTKARSEQVSLSDTPYYHCYSRCVRGAFLCGFDAESGVDYAHRKQWIVSRIRQLSSVFCLDVCAYAVMDNHYHVVLRVDVDAVSALSDVDVLVRWASLFSGSVLVQRYLSPQREAMSAGEVVKVLEIVAALRERLVDISWFMRCLNEFIARMANKEDGCKGRFWEGRFKSQALLDEVAVLACMAYVDLNPIRAGLADTPEQSDFTSIQERIKGYQVKTTEVNNTESNVATVGSKTTLLGFVGNERQEQAKGITYTLEDYLELVDWTGRAIIDGKRGAIPDDLPPILSRLKVDPAQWVRTVQQFHRRYPRMAGGIEQLKAMAEQLGLRWMHGIGASRLLYRV